jgi:hypothetical protein
VLDPVLTLVVFFIPQFVSVVAIALSDLWLTEQLLFSCHSWCVHLLDQYSICC